MPSLPAMSAQDSYMACSGEYLAHSSHPRRLSRVIKDLCHVRDLYLLPDAHDMVQQASRSDTFHACICILGMRTLPSYRHKLTGTFIGLPNGTSVH